MQHTIDSALLFDRLLNLSEQGSCSVDSISRPDDAYSDMVATSGIGLAVRPEGGKPSTGINTSLFAAEQKLGFGR